MLDEAVTTLTVTTQAEFEQLNLPNFLSFHEEWKVRQMGIALPRPSILRMLEGTGLPFLRSLYLFQTQICSLEIISKIRMPLLLELYLVQNRVVWVRELRKCSWDKLFSLNLGMSLDMVKDTQKLSELKSENLYDACYCMNSNQDRAWIAKTRYGHLHYLKVFLQKMKLSKGTNSIMSYKSCIHKQNSDIITLVLINFSYQKILKEGMGNFFQQTKQVKLKPGYVLSPHQVKGLSTDYIIVNQHSKWDSLDFGQLTKKINQWNITQFFFYIQHKNTILKNIQNIRFLNLKVLLISNSHLESIESICRIQTPSLVRLVLTSNKIFKCKCLRKLTFRVNFLCIGNNPLMDTFFLSEMKQFSEIEYPIVYGFQAFFLYKLQIQELRSLSNYGRKIEITQKNYPKTLKKQMKCLTSKRFPLILNRIR